MRFAGSNIASMIRAERRRVFQRAGETVAGEVGLTPTQHLLIFGAILRLIHADQKDADSGTTTWAYYNHHDEDS